MPQSAIVDSRLFVRHDLDPTLKANILALVACERRAHLARQMLLYDNLVIPTHDFGIVPILIQWMGMRLFRRALDRGVFRFLRLDNLVGYAGNGAGLKAFRISPGKGRRWKWWQETLFGSVDRAIELQLQHMCPSFPRKERTRIGEEVLRNTRSIELGDRFERAIRHESYMDVIRNRELASIVARNNRDIQRLSGVEANQLRVLGLEGIKDEIDLLLAIAEVNLEIFLSTAVDGADLLCSDGAQNLLRNKLLRHGASQHLLEGFLSLLELNGIPDIGAPIAAGELTIYDIWRIRNTRCARRFRSWLREAGSEDTRELEKMYISTLRSKATIEKLPLRVLRFVITAGAGCLNLSAGLLTSAIDSFFVERWLRGYSPRVFIDEVHRLQIGSK